MKDLDNSHVLKTRRYLNKWFLAKTSFLRFTNCNKFTITDDSHYIFNKRKSVSNSFQKLTIISYRNRVNIKYYVWNFSAAGWWFEVASAEVFLSCLTAELFFALILVWLSYLLSIWGGDFRTWRIKNVFWIVENIGKWLAVWLGKAGTSEIRSVAKGFAEIMCRCCKCYFAGCHYFRGVSWVFFFFNLLWLSDEAPKAARKHIMVLLIKSTWPYFSNMLCNIMLNSSWDSDADVWGWLLFKYEKSILDKRKLWREVLV